MSDLKKCQVRVSNHMIYTGRKELSYKTGATKAVLTQLRKIKAAADVMMMCKLNVLRLFEHYFI